MRIKEFYDKYILKDLSVKKTFARFSKENRRIFRKLSKKVTSPKFKLLMSNKIILFSNGMPMDKISSLFLYIN